MAGPAEPVVWVIDAEQWPRACLRAELIERGLDAVGYTETLPALVALHHPRTTKPQVIVLELRGQHMKKESLGALARSGVPVIILGGAAELREPVVNEFDWAAVMRRPFTIGAVADKVEELARR
ncbi:MAG TPA: hypothetical protein VNO70_26595 [Blastocatellia bacterium]|nr:hypothetical protein [Blastocatellia bacterium]